MLDKEEIRIITLLLDMMIFFYDLCLPNTHYFYNTIILITMIIEDKFIY